MYVSSGADIPGISTGPIDPRYAARFNARRRRVFLSVADAASRYDCAPAVSSFGGLNLKFQAARARSLLNQVGQAIASTFPTGPSGMPSITEVQQSVTPTGSSGAPAVVPLAPVNTNPIPPPPTPATQWAAPHWANASAPAGVVPVALTAASRHPWVTLGVLAVIALAGGALNGSRGRA